MFVCDYYCFGLCISAGNEISEVLFAKFENRPMPSFIRSSFAFTLSGSVPPYDRIVRILARQSNSVIEEAKDFVRENSGLNQYVPEDPTGSEEVSENIRNRDLLINLVSVAQSIGHLPDEGEIENHSKYSVDRFREEFGGLFEACYEAGIVPDSVTKDDYTAASEAKRKQETSQAEDHNPKSSPGVPSEAELIEELQWVDQEVEGVPSPTEMNESGTFTGPAYQSLFGSWDEALDAAGIDKGERLLEDMNRVAEKVGVDLTQSEMNEYGRHSSTMAARYFGSWTDAKERLQEWRRKEEGDDSSMEFDNMVNDRLDDILE